MLFRKESSTKCVDYFIFPKRKKNYLYKGQTYTE